MQISEPLTMRILSILLLSLIVAAPAVYIISRLAWHIAEVLP